MDTVPYSYEGKEGRLNGKAFRLGPKVIFESNDPTEGEWTRHLRILYADGGWFASGVTYREFLTDRLSPKTPNEIVVHAAELARCETSQMPETQDEMRSSLDEGIATLVPTSRQQLELTL